MASLYDTIQQRKKTNPLNVSQPKPIAPQQTQTITQPVSNPAVSVFPKTTQPNIQQNFGMWSAEGGVIKTPTLATRETPIMSVSTVPTPVDINTADMNTLLKEQDAINYKISTGAYTQDDYVRGREINRKLSESMYQTPEMSVNPQIAELEAKAQALKTKDNNPEVAARREQLQANLNIKKAQLEENARRARESTIGNIAMSWGGRSSVAQQAELDIQKELQNQLNAEQAAMDLEIMAYERQLAGATEEELSSINNSINTLKTQSAQSQMVLEQKNKEQQQASLWEFDKTLQSLAQKQGIKLDVNDEAALSQVINISRNSDWSVNESVVAWLPKEYQALVRAWVTAWVWQKLTSAPKVERIGGTTKAPIYGYWDGTKFVTTNAQWVPTVRSGWGGSWWGASSGWASTWIDLSWVWAKDKNLVTLLTQYKQWLDETSYLWLATDPVKSAIQQNLLSQITAEYKNAKKLGTLDLWVQRLIDWLVGKWWGITNLSKYSNDAQSKAVESFISSLGGKVNNPSVPQPTATQNPTKWTTWVSKYKWRKII